MSWSGAFDPLETWLSDSSVGTPSCQGKSFAARTQQPHCCYPPGAASQFGSRRNSGLVVAGLLARERMRVPPEHLRSSADMLSARAGKRQFGTLASSLRAMEQALRDLLSRWGVARKMLRLELNPPAFTEYYQWSLSLGCRSPGCLSSQPLRLLLRRTGLATGADGTLVAGLRSARFTTFAQQGLLMLAASTVTKAKQALEWRGWLPDFSKWPLCSALPVSACDPGRWRCGGLLPPPTLQSQTQGYLRSLQDFEQLRFFSHWARVRPLPQLDWT